MLALPVGWLNPKLVEIYCLENEGNGKKRLTTGVIDNPVLWLKFRKELYPDLTRLQYRGSLKRMCFDQGAGYRDSPFGSNLRQLLADRINEIGRKTWPCFKQPSTEQLSQVDSTLPLRTILTSQFGIDIDSDSIPNSTAVDSGGDAIVDDREQCVVGEHTTVATNAKSGFFGQSPTNTVGAGTRGAASASGAASSSAATSAGAGASAGSAASVSVHDTIDAFEPRTYIQRRSDFDDEDAAEEEEEDNNSVDDIDSDILDVLDAKESSNDDSNEHDMATLQKIGRMFISVVTQNGVVTDTVLDNQYQAIEKHYASCFKYPDRLGVVLTAKFHIVDFTPHTYANEQAIRLIGKDVTKEFHVAHTVWAMIRITAMFAKSIFSRAKPWLLRSLTKVPFNCFEADGTTKCIRFHDVWGTTELFNDKHFVVMFSLAGENELLRQPGPFRPDTSPSVAEDK